MPSASPSAAGAPARSPRARPLRFLAAVVVMSLATLLGATMAVGRAPTPIAAIDPALLTRVVAVAEAPRPVAEVLAARSEPVVLEAIPDFRPATRVFEPRPEPQLKQSAVVVVKPKPRPVRRPQSRATGGGGSGGVTGTATWYCRPGVSSCHNQYPGGLYAAAGPALRVGSWRGRSVQVCSGGGCVSVRLIDWCACGGSRVIDLYSDAFRRIGSLSQGTMRVTVSW